MSVGEKIDLSGDGGVVKEILQEGIGDELPLSGCTVSLHYTGKLTDGTVFDSSLDRGEPFEFVLGRGMVIKAFDIGVPTIKKHEKCVLTSTAKYSYGAEGSPPSIPPNATLIYELEMLGWKGEDISPNKDGAIERIILKGGDKRRTPNEGELLKIKLVGKYEERIFEEREVQFNLGEGSAVGVVEGVELGLAQMSIGETSRFIIKQNYAFGLEGNEEYKIPAKATVVYEVTLLECEKGREEWLMSDQERVDQAGIYKEKGTNYFSKQNYKLAIKMYKNVASILSNVESLPDETKKLLIAAHNNLALCHQKCNDDFDAKNACTEVLKLDANNIKALYRRGQCNLNINEYSDALQDFQKVLSLDANNKAAINQIAICKQKIKESNQREKSIYANMFSKLALADKEPIQPNYSDVLAKCGEWTEDDLTRVEAEYALEHDDNIIMLSDQNS